MYSKQTVNYTSKNFLDSRWISEVLRTRQLLGVTLSEKIRSKNDKLVYVKIWRRNELNSIIMILLDLSLL